MHKLEPGNSAVLMLGRGSPSPLGCKDIPEAGCEDPLKRERWGVGPLLLEGRPGTSPLQACFIYLFIYLLWTALGLCCCARAFSSCGEQGLLFIAVRRPLIAVASLVAEHGL